MEREAPLSLTRIDPLRDQRWQPFVDTHPAALAFHSAGWIGAIHAAFGYEARVHALEQDGDIVAAWPSMLVRSRLTGTRLVTLPFSHCAGPLVSTPRQADLLLGAVLGDTKALNADSTEVRDWPTNLEMPTSLHKIDPFRRHVIDLTSGSDAIWQSIDKDMRYSIRRAQKNGVTVRTGSSNEDLDTFFSMYSRQRRRQSLLPQPKRFIREIFARMIRQGDGVLVISEHHGRPVAALLSIHGSGTAIGTHSAALPEARNLRAIPPAVFRSIEVACERELLSFDLGRTDKGAVGLRHFKEGWGATEVSMPYLYYPEPRGVNTKPPSGLKKSALNLYCRVMPDPLFASVSASVYRHLG
jgi:lipid II:glycine glycyltransferase (peptidoglycan interpeptide bridge formation enzyme)